MKRSLLLYLVLWPFFAAQAQNSDLPALEYRRVVVCEEVTATWCGFCPRGMVGMAKMKEKYPDSFIGIAVHDYSYNYDPMRLPGYADGLYRFFTSLPKALVNRRQIGDPYFDLESMYKNEMAKPVTSAMGVSVSYTDESKTTLSVRIQTKFAFASEEERYVYALVVLENDVRGTASGYAQANNYSGRAEVIGNFNSLPSPVPASQMVYQDVARTIFPGFDGMPASVPGKFAKDEILGATYYLQVPLNVLNKDNMEVAVLLIDHTTGEIVNAAKAAPSGTATASESVSAWAIEMVAVQDGSYIRADIQAMDSEACTIELYNASGQLVGRQSAFPNSPVSFAPDRSGLYFVRVTDGKQVVVKKVIWHPQ